MQDAENPAIMYNHGNEYLHYQDDWYILGYKPDTYVVRHQASPSVCYGLWAA